MGSREAAREARATSRAARHAPGTPLTRERIVTAALALVDREGLAALSMRRLGAELGADPMAAYHYLPNKQALLDAIVEAVMAEIDLSVDQPSEPPEERLVYAALAYRDVLLAHRNALPILLSRGPSTPAAMRPVELLIGILRDAGLPAGEAFAGMNAIAATVRGTVGMVAGETAEAPGPDHHQAQASELPPEAFPNLHEMALCAPDFLGRDFEFGIRALARGLLAGAGER